MMKKVGTILLSIALTLGITSIVYTKSSYLTQFNTRYGTAATALNTCTLCHTTVPNLNTYGDAFLSSSHNFATIEPLDSDSDGFTNIVEINAGTFPGDPNSKPAPADTTAPTITGFTLPPASTTLSVPYTITATDNAGGTGVVGYLVKESSTPAPASSDPGWSTSSSGNYPFATPGSKTLYAWAKDGAGNVSASMSASTTITLPPVPDTTPPTVTGFTLPPASTTLSVPYTITATDTAGGTGVAGYLVKESPTPAPTASDPGWSASSSGNYPFATPGSKTLYAWAKDGAGNVSDSLSAAIIINTPSQEPLPDMTLWVGKWFKITEKNTGYSFGNSGFRTDSGSYVGYLKLWNWDPNNKVLQGDRYEQDANSGQWFSEPLTLHYIAGSNLDFLCSFQVTDDTTNMSSGFTARVHGREVSGVLGTATLKTLGGYYVEMSNGSSSTEYYAGGLKITGNLISDSKVPVPAEVILH